MEEAEEDDEDRDPQADMYAKYDACLHGPRAEGDHPPLSMHFLKKFFSVIRRRARCGHLPARLRMLLCSPLIYGGLCVLYLVLLWHHAVWVLRAESSWTSFVVSGETLLALCIVLEMTAWAPCAVGPSWQSRVFHLSCEGVTVTSESHVAINALQKSSADCMADAVRFMLTSKLQVTQDIQHGFSWSILVWAF